MFTFSPTHEITLVLDDARRIDVEVQLVRGAAYTREEWLTGRPARWRVADGSWTWSGRPLPSGCVMALIRPAAVAAIGRLAWELAVGAMADTDIRLVLCGDPSGSPTLWLEARDERLRLEDATSSLALPTTVTARHVRGLVREWEACKGRLSNDAAPRPKREDVRGRAPAALERITILPFSNERPEVRGLDHDSLEWTSCAASVPAPEGFTCRRPTPP